MTDFSGARGTDNRPAEQPALIDTGKGFSVSYLGRLLYSRYDPLRIPLGIIKSTPLRNETLIICPSPLLGYALAELLDTLSEDCLVLAIECDETLMAFSVAQIPEQVLKHPRFRYIRTSSPAKAVEYIDGLGLRPFRRCLRLDLSGGSALNGRFYDDTVKLVDGYIQQYWRNHFTLMKLGRNYARNFFRNLPTLASSTDAGTLIERDLTGKKAILVAGAGPSLDVSIPFIRSHRKELFILAVDTALRSLEDSGVAPDAAVLVESQFWIERAFTGFRASRIPLLADLTARPSAVAALGGERAFFLSEYANLRYLRRFLDSDKAIPVIQPLGSVGLVALELASDIAKKYAHQETPIFFTGLDFSWGRGLTHSRGAPAANEERMQANRFAPAGSRVPSVSPGVIASTGKDGEVAFTDPALSGYAQLCAEAFAQSTGLKSRQIFDLGTTGLDMGFTRATAAAAEMKLAEATPVQAATEIPGIATKTADRARLTDSDPDDRVAQKKAIRIFLESEKEKLETVRSVLTGTIDIENANDFLSREIRDMDYLFAHFPDAYKGYRNDPDFLKRVRVELEYFLKTINTAITEL